MTRRRHYENSTGRPSRSDDSPIWQTALIRHSGAFESFYKAQKLLPPSEWETFLSCLQSDLPTAFRVVTITPHRHYILKFLERTMESLQGRSPGGLPGDSKGRILELRNALKPLGWYKTGNEAFQLEISRHVLRSCKLLLDLHRFLVNQSEAATIFRQEAVSMIPALFLEKEMRGDSLILDMCAAPGSKTSQLLEALHKAAEREGSAQNCGTNGWPILPTGAVVANDADSTRSHMLVHHLRHLHSPCLLVTSHAAQFFPTLFQPREAVDESHEAPSKGVHSPPVNREACEENNTVCNTAAPPNISPILFDGVLCDVPCSGDGTLRKKRALWESWSPHQGLGCHRLQLQILLRGIKLCRIGGRIVYSTCAFNPIENEAVVRAAIMKSKGAVILEDCTEDLPLLTRSPGMTQWGVEWEGRWYETYDDVPKTVRASKKIWPSMFPATGKEGENVPLHRCMRIFPHVNNTGGFFVAVMRKVRNVPMVAALSDTNNLEVMSEPATESSAPALAGSLMQPKRLDGSGCEEEAFFIEKESACCSSERSQQLRRFDQMQLDMVCLDWGSEMLQRQHHQIVLQAERAASTSKEQGVAQGNEALERGCSRAAAAPDSSVGHQERSAPFAVNRTLLEQTAELVFRTLNLPEGMLVAKDASPRQLHDLLLGGLCPLLCFRIKTSEALSTNLADGLSADGQLEDGDRRPRRVYYISRGVKKLLEATGASRYKIISGGCLAFQARCKGVYRATYGGAAWVAPFYEAAMRQLAEWKNQADVEAPVGTDPLDSLDGGRRNASSMESKRRVFTVPCELLYRLVASEQDQRRVDLRKIEEAPFGSTVVQESSEGPLLFLTRLRPADAAGGLSSTKIAVCPYSSGGAVSFFQADEPFSVKL
ncbi:hypothetical protein Efla_003089 [Eimeria flavescens]